MIRPEKISRVTVEPVLNNVPGSRGMVILTDAFKDPAEAVRVMLAATRGRRPTSPHA